MSNEGEWGYEDWDQPREGDQVTTFTREQLDDISEYRGISTEGDLAAFAIALLDRAETAEKRMKAWGCPDYDYICLNCGRETPCITEADLRPGDPGVPCTFDLTYPQMIERLRHYEDRQRKAEAERDEARAMKVPATTEAVMLAEMGEKVARTEAWAAKEELRIAEAERDRLRAELREAEEAIRSLCHVLPNSLHEEECWSWCWDALDSEAQDKVDAAWHIPATRRALTKAEG